jgi:hypothetical protein
LWVSGSRAKQGNSLLKKGRFTEAEILGILLGEGLAGD